jgi:hypothetical protein
MNKLPILRSHVIRIQGAERSAYQGNALHGWQVEARTDAAKF